MSFSLFLGLAYFLFLSLIGFSGGYGIFVDEYYYLACAKRLAWGYVDQPPLSIFLLSLFQINEGSEVILRILPSAFAGFSIFLVGNLTKTLNGSNLSVGLACIATMTAPVLQVIFGFYSMNVIEVFFVILLLTLFTKIKENTNHWISVGIVIGLGILNKHTFAVYVFAVLIPYFLYNAKSILSTKTFYLGMVITILIISPNIYWQYVHSFPSLEFYKNAYSMKNIHLSYFQILVDQVLSQNPATLPLWVCGIFFFLKKKEIRFVAVAYFLLLLFFLASNSSRPDRIAAYYPILFVGGSIFISSNQIKKILLSAILILGIFLSPIGIPILPVDLLSKYVNFLGIVPKIEAGNRTLLPQWFADRLDWKVFHTQMLKAIASLEPHERMDTAILGNFYGQAASLEFYKTPIPVISGHNNYYLWLGELKGTPKNLIVTGDDALTAISGHFEEKILLGYYSRNYTKEQNVPIYLLKNSKINLKNLIQSLKNYR